jgi:uncharacterized peroxidase-related enzyme
MSHIPLESHLPGITGLLEYRRDTAEPIRDLTQILLRGPSTLSIGERELIASIVSHDNECKFCTMAHTAVTDFVFGDFSIAEKVKNNLESAPVGDKMKALLKIARLVGQSGKNVTDTSIEEAKKHGATDIEIHDTVLIASLFCLYNRYVDGLATHLPQNPNYFTDLAERLSTNGYERTPEVYEKLKKDQEHSNEN